MKGHQDDTSKHECLNHFVIFGHRHLDYLVSEFVEYYNKFRSHSAREFRPPDRDQPLPENNVFEPDEIVCREHLGGLIKSYERRAA